MTTRLEEGSGKGNDGGGGLGRLTLDGSGAALSPKDILRHLGLTSGGQLRVVVEPMTIDERLAAAKKKKSKDDDDDEASEASEKKPSSSGAGVNRASQIDAGGDHDDHGRSVGSSKGGDNKGSGGVVPLHYTPQAEMASIRPVGLRSRSPRNTAQTPSPPPAFLTKKLKTKNVRCNSQTFTTCAHGAWCQGT